MLATSLHHHWQHSSTVRLYHDDNYYNHHHNHCGNDNDEGSDKGDKGIGQGFESQTRLELQVRSFFLFSYLSLIYIIYSLYVLPRHNIILNATSANHSTSRE
jgi:hypothetical protein